MRDTSIETLDVNPKKKLEEHFSSLSKKIRNKKKVQSELDKFVEQNKDNEVLKQYMKLIEKLDEMSKAINAKDGFKQDIYEDMVACNEDKVEDKYCKVNLVKPYDKTVFDLDLFLQDYKPTSKMYNKYVQKQNVKGHIKITEL